MVIGYPATFLAMHARNTQRTWPQTTNFANPSALLLSSIALFFISRKYSCCTRFRADLELNVKGALDSSFLATGRRCCDEPPMTTRKPNVTKRLAIVTTAWDSPFAMRVHDVRCRPSKYWHSSVCVTL